MDWLDIYDYGDSFGREPCFHEPKKYPHNWWENKKFIEKYCFKKCLIFDEECKLHSIIGLKDHPIRKKCKAIDEYYKNPKEVFLEKYCPLFSVSFE